MRMIQGKVIILVLNNMFLEVIEPYLWEIISRKEEFKSNEDLELPRNKDFGR